MEYSGSPIGVQMADRTTLYSDGHPIVIYLLKRMGSTGQQVLPIQVLKRAYAEHIRLKDPQPTEDPKRLQEWNKESKLILNALKVRASATNPLSS